MISQRQDVRVPGGNRMRSVAPVLSVVALLLASGVWAIRMPDARSVQNVPVTGHAARAAVPLPPRLAHAPLDLFDSAMQQLACRARREQHAAQIARGAGAAAPESASNRCVAGTQLQIEAMLRTAAANGDADAKRYLLARRAAELLQRAVAGAPAGMPAQLSASDEQEMAAIVAELEALALAGHRDAIDTLAQVVESPLLLAPDPVYAAAWRLASRQPPGHALDPSAPLQAEDELLESLTQQQQQQARGLAVELFGYCCRGRTATAD